MLKKFRHGEAERKNLVGIATGLAYTDFGGDILAIEAVLMPGKGRRQVTGHLGRSYERVNPSCSILCERSMLHF